MEIADLSGQIKILTKSIHELTILVIILCVVIGNLVGFLVSRGK